MFVLKLLKPYYCLKILKSTICSIGEPNQLGNFTTCLACFNKLLTDKKCMTLFLSSHLPDLFTHT